jgi:HAE1 family hydrophobic/amphiphilic exporter-1
MSIASISIKRPVFITCVIIIMLVLGYISMKRLSVELFPDVSPPVISVITAYPGTGPAEIETLVTKPLEDSVSTIAGVKRVTSASLEGVSQVICEFYMDQDIKQAEQRIRDKVSQAKVKFPLGVKEPIVQAFDLGDQPIMTIGLQGNMNAADLFDIADQQIKPRLQQLRDVGSVTILGGRKREVQVLLDRDTLRERGFSARYVAGRLTESGANIPAGKVNEGDEEAVFRSRGEFHSLDEISDTVLSLFGNDNPTKIRDVGKVIDTLEDEKNRVYVNGESAIIIQVFKQSKTNSVAIAKRVRDEMPKLEASLKSKGADAKLALIRDGSREIDLNILDVNESIFLGILLTIIVVFLFLGNFRSTLITGLALPNSLLGSFILMQAFGLSINIVTLLALSLVVGLLIDDAIVVRENIFRYIENGKSPKEAALSGTAEVTLAVVATTLVVMSVFGPIALTQGLVGRILANFGLTICFAMAISLFDALTIAPMLSAYFAGNVHAEKSKVWRYTLGAVVSAFDRMQGWLESVYEQLIRIVVRFPVTTVVINLVICFACFSTVGSISKTFIPAQDSGEFTVTIEMPQGTNLGRTDTVAQEIDKLIRSYQEVDTVSLTVGGRNGESHKGDFYVRLKPPKQRQRGLIAVKEDLREKLLPFAYAKPKVQEFDFSGGGQGRPVMLNLLSNDTEELAKYTEKLLAHLKQDSRLKDLDSSYREGKKEFSFELNSEKAQIVGMNTALLGQELRAQVQGIPATVYRKGGYEYDVRVLMKPEQRNLHKDFNDIYVMNLNNRLVKLASVSSMTETRAQASIDRQNRSRYIQISAGLDPKAGIGDVVADLDKLLTKGDLKLPPGTTYALIGQSENFAELAESMVFVLLLGITFIYLVLSSLYESFITPFTIILTLPLALCGAFVALYMTNQSINLFSGLGMLMLLGVSCKNSILLVDFTNQKRSEGVPLKDAIIAAGKTRLRPILMTSIALIAGTIPIAIGLNEASNQRVSMGIGIIGGVISSTILSLIVVPAILPFFYWVSDKSSAVVRWVGGGDHK